MTEQQVSEYYTATVRQEWNRLVRTPYQRLEFDTTMRFLRKYLPPRGLILDAGGGPGRYTIELARQGYNMVLLDISPANLAFASRCIARAHVEEKVQRMVRGTIVDLSDFPDNTFDAVLCLGGPLSHVLDAGRRHKAIRELMRVAKKNAPIVASVMGRLSVLAYELVLFQHEIELPHFKKVRDTGTYRGGHGFTACHFFLPEEFSEAFRQSGVRVLTMVGLEGLSSRHSIEINRLAKNTRRWKIWLETHYRMCTHPAVVGTSDHILLVGTKV